MTAQTLTLTDFLLARIAEDEAEVLGAGHWDGDPEWWLPDWVSRERLLADCKCKRRIVALHSLEPDPQPDENWLGLCAVCNSTTEGYPCTTLRTLALPYADHPDFNPEWRA